MPPSLFSVGLKGLYIWPSLHHSHTVKLQNLIFLLIPMRSCGLGIVHICNVTFLYLSVSVMIPIDITVKPELVVTSIKQPPALNSHAFKFPLD